MQATNFITVLGSNIGILASVITVIIFVWTILKYFSARAKRRSLSRLWRQNAKPWQIVIPLYNNEQRNKQDSEAAYRLSRFFDQSGVTYSSVDDSDAKPNGSNLICVCGPKANQISAQIARDHPFSWEIRWGDDNIPYIFDHTHNEQRYAKPQQDGFQTELAIVARLKSRSNDGITLLCWGLGRIGTMGAVDALLNKDCIDQIEKDAKGGDFICIVTVPYADSMTIGAPVVNKIRTRTDIYISKTDKRRAIPFGTKNTVMDYLKDKVAGIVKPPKVHGLPLQRDRNEN